MPERVLPLAQKAAQLLTERGIENGRLEAELLLAHILGIKRLDLYLQFERPLNAVELEQFRQVVRRRLKREPLQYVTGRASFRHIELKVDRRVLIPRPETEVLVGVVLSFIGDRAVRVLDVGTGSGAIAISIAKEAPAAAVVATDVSVDALTLARENAGAFSIDFRHGDMLDPVAGEVFDVIVSNPPYVTESERATLQPEVRDWEPETALFAGPDGLDAVRALIASSPPRLSAGGMLAIEVGSTQTQDVAGLLVASSSYENIQIIRDLSGRDRIVTAVRRRDGQ